MKLALKDVRVGLRVRVTKVIDGCGNSASIGATGRIARVERGTAGCGDSKRHPFIHVRFDKRVRDGREPIKTLLRSDGYWREELVRLNPKRRRSP